MTPLMDYAAIRKHFRGEVVKKVYEAPTMVVTSTDDANVAEQDAVGNFLADIFHRWESGILY